MIPYVIQKINPWQAESVDRSGASIFGYQQNLVKYVYNTHQLHSKCSYISQSLQCGDVLLPDEFPNCRQRGFFCYNVDPNPNIKEEDRVINDSFCADVIPSVSCELYIIHLTCDIAPVLTSKFLQL